MKKVLVVLIVGVLFLGFSAQRAEAQNTNIAQKIIGTWVSQSGQTFVFKANGTITVTSSNGESTQEYRYGVTDTKIAIDGPRDFNIYDISISSDGKTLIYNRQNNGSSTGTWLTKK